MITAVFFVQWLFFTLDLRTDVLYNIHYEEHLFIKEIIGDCNE